MRTTVFEIDTGGRLVVDVTDEVGRAVALGAESGLVHVFLPHATAGLALMETGSGSEGDLEDELERLFPRDDRYRHRHGSVGHGGDHLLPVFVPPVLVLEADGGRLMLGTWQRIVVVDPNRENDVRRVRVSVLAG
ncbi:MAG TPA: YjbQ family protein [Actinomycetota bacterium]